MARKRGFWAAFWAGFTFSPLPPSPVNKRFEEIRRRYRTMSDAEMIAEDWRVVGCDLQLAIDKVGAELKEPR